MSSVAHGAAALAILASALATMYVAPYAVKIRRQRELRVMCRQQRGLVLTYDDGLQ